jgi:hypothetical protein
MLKLKNFKYYLTTNKNKSRMILQNSKFIHSKIKHHNITHYRVFIDPFEHLKNIENLSSRFNMTLKIDNDKIPLKLESLDLTSDYEAEKDTKCNIDAHHLFDFFLNEDQTDITIEPKSLDYLEWFINKSINIEKKQLHVILKATNSENLNVELSNCQSRVHNSTHFKQETSSLKESKLNVKPMYLNPYFKKINFIFNKCEINFEKFDHKFVNCEYTYSFKIYNSSYIYFKKFFIYQMDCKINSSTVTADKIMGYKVQTDPFHTKNLLSLQTINSSITIKNYLHCGNFDCKSIVTEEVSSFPSNNIININNFSSNSFNFSLNPNDKLSMHVYDLTDNSHLKCNKETSNIRIHPLLLISLNIYEVLNGKFMSLLMMGREGYVFCPTILIDTNVELKKQDLMAWEMIRMGNNYKSKLFYILLLYFVWLILNSKEKVAQDISEFKLYQLFLKKTLNDYISNLENKK